MDKKKRFRWNAVIDRVKDIEGPIIGAELGVWKGKMSYFLLSELPNLNLHMVDRWAPPEEGDSYHTSGSQMALCNTKDFDRVYAEAMAKVFPFKDRAIVYEMTTVGAALNVDNGMFDFVFIDADHSYEGVRNDIAAWKDKVKPGGWLCGHDWKNIKKGNVEKAVREFFKPEQIEVDANSTWFVRM